MARKIKAIKEGKITITDNVEEIYEKIVTPGDVLAMILGDLFPEDKEKQAQIESDKAVYNRLMNKAGE